MHRTRFRVGVIASALAVGCSGNIETIPGGSGGTAATTSTGATTTTTSTTTTSTTTTPGGTPANVCDCATRFFVTSPGACGDCAQGQTLAGGACSDFEFSCEVDPTGECQTAVVCAAQCAMETDPATCMESCAPQSPILQELMTCACGGTCEEACSVATPLACDLGPGPVTCSEPQPFCASSCFQAAAATCDAGYWWCPPNTGPFCSCGVNDVFTCFTPSGCCMNDSDCGDTGSAVCVNSVCKPMTPGHCWTDKDCLPGATCVGALACPCNESCQKPDEPGTCLAP